MAAPPIRITQEELLAALLLLYYSQQCCECAFQVKTLQLFRAAQLRSQAAGSGSDPLTNVKFF